MDDSAFALQAVFAALVFMWGVQWLRRKDDRPPGPFRWPVVGSMLQVLRHNSKYPHVGYTHFASKYGPIVFYQMGAFRAVVISGFETCKQILTNEEWRERFDDKLSLERVYGKRIGLIHGLGNLWRKTRSFTVRNLRDYGYGRKETLEMFARQEVDDMRRNIDDIILQKDGHFELHQFFNVPFVNIIWAMSTGMRFNHNDPQVKKLVKGIEDVNRTLKFNGGILHAFPVLLQLVPDSWLGVSDCRLAMMNFRNHMEAIIESYRQKGTYMAEPENFIEIFLQHIDRARSGDIEDHEGVFTDENLVAILYDFFWAGSDTTSATMTYGILWLTLNQQAQRKLRQELREFIEQNKRPPAEADKHSLPYTRATLLEIVRRSVVFPLGPRKVDIDTRCSKFVVPKDCSVLVNYHSVLMDEGFWGDPNNFRPERFLDFNNEIVNAERVIAFSLGKRNCVGETIAQVSLFLFTTFLFSNYEILPISDDCHYETLPIPGIVMSPPPFAVRIKALCES